MYHHIKKIFVDDDQDCIVIEVLLSEPDKGGKEASCDGGYRRWFYREIPLGELNSKNRNLKFIENKKSFDPEKVYKDIPNPTKI